MKNIKDVNENYSIYNVVYIKNFKTFHLWVEKNNISYLYHLNIHIKINYNIWSFKINNWMQ